MSKDLSRRTLLAATLGAAALAVPGVAEADSFPSKPIRIIDPWPPGGGTDVLTRAIAPIWEKELGVPIQVVNKPGGNNIVGYKALLDAPPDGHTLIIAQFPNVAVNALFQDAPYKVSDFAFLHLFQKDETIFFANKDTPWNNLSDLISDAKKKPGTIKIGMVNVLGIDWVQLKEFEEKAGIEFGETVPIGGGSPLRREVIGGHLKLALHGAWVARKGKGLVEGLGVRSMRRSPIWPDAQTFNEVLPADRRYTQEELRLPRVFKGYAVSNEVKKEYPGRFKILSESFERAMKRPEWQEMVKRQELDWALDYHPPEAVEPIANAYLKALNKYSDFFMKLQKGQ